MADISRFKKLADKIKKQYVKKGVSEDEAEERAEGAAANIGRKKYGKKRFQKMIERGK